MVTEQTPARQPADSADETKDTDYAIGAVTRDGDIAVIATVTRSSIYDADTDDSSSASD